MKLSVAMITYNHERFIAQAIQSALNQRVNFPYEIVVGDDHSTDSTPAIIADFHRHYPDRIVSFSRKNNLGAIANFKETLGACRGEYLAILEGDDYWTDQLKLQEQVNFLDAHPDHTVACARAETVNESDVSLNGLQPNYPAGSYGVADLLRGNFVVTCTAICRRDAVPRIPAWFDEMKLADWPLWALAAQKGKIRLLDKVVAAYRVHSGGSWSSRTQAERLQETIRMLTALDAELAFRHNRTIRETLVQFSLEWGQIAQAEHQRTQIARAVFVCLRNGGWQLPGRRRLIAGLAAYALIGSSYKKFSKILPLKP